MSLILTDHSIKMPHNIIFYFSSLISHPGKLIPFELPSPPLPVPTSHSLRLWVEALSGTHTPTPTPVPYNISPIYDVGIQSKKLEFKDNYVAMKYRNWPRSSFQIKEFSSGIVKICTPLPVL